MQLFLAFLVCLLVLLAGVSGLVVYADNPEWIFNGLGVSEKASPKYEALKFLGISMGGLLIAIQAAIANKRANAMDKTASSQAKATEEQAKANEHTEQGQRQERLKNAIEHLGHTSDSVRLGGAYELFHLARDTGELRQTVLDILCAHIRRTTGESEYRARRKSKPSEEVQSLLTLLFVQDHEVFENMHINLQGSWLDGSNLREARLEKAVLTEAYLRGADLAEADLKEANMMKAHLQGADLTKARIQRACLRRARMQGSCLNEARLNGAKLYGVQMQGAELMAARMEGAYFWHAEMQGAVLYNARLQLAMLTYVELQAACLAGAQLQGATLVNVNLSGAVREGSKSFEVRIKDRSEVPASLGEGGAIFQGGLTEQNVESILEVVSCGEPGVLRARLEFHIDMPESHELPEDSAAPTGAYTKEQAEKWIAEYQKAMSEVPAESDS